MARRRLPRAARLLAAALLAAALAPQAEAARGAAEPARLCLDAADRAAARHSVPRAVMRALTRTETGRGDGSGALAPWPWTVNMEGEGHWFDAPAEALAYVARERARGARSFDIGCFQINHLWHGEAFPSVEAMFDPDANADYAATFLKGLHEESGDWERAAGLYHSRTPEFRDRYSARFARILAAGDPEAPLTAVAEARAAPGPRLTYVSDLPVTAGAVAVRNIRGAAGPLARGAAGPLIAAAGRPLFE